MLCAVGKYTEVLEFFLQVVFRLKFLQLQGVRDHFDLRNLVIESREQALCVLGQYFLFLLVLGKDILNQLHFGMLFFVMKVL